MDQKELEKLDGTVEHIIYSSDDSGFTVMELDHGGELMTVVGVLPGVAAGEEVSLTGSYTTHPTYGRQFKAEICERTLPATASAIYKYLSSGAIKGVGPRTARRMVDTFGDKTLEIIEKQPEKLTEIPRISHTKAMEVHDQYKQIFGIRTVMLALTRYGISPSMSIRVWKQWGILSMEVIEKDPYQLCCDAVGAPFEVADEIALRLELSQDNPLRIRAGIVHVLNHNLGNGHTCLPEHQLVPTAATLLGIDSIYVEDQLLYCLDESLLISDTIKDVVYIYLPEMYEAETYIAGRIQIMLSTQYPETVSHQKAVNRLEKSLDIAYADMQKRAIETALNNSVFILTGGPGTGKTTALNGIITLLEEQGLKTALAAPTGRAAKRMSEVCSRDAKTIHRLLEVDFRNPDSSAITFKRNEKNPLRYDAIILDEVSMVDTQIFYSLLRAMPLSCKLILVGDPDQLPSVGSGNILGDLIDSDMVPTVHLIEIFRQAKESHIVIASHEIVRGIYPDLTNTDSDFFFLNRASYDDTMLTTLDLCARRLPKAYNLSAMWDIQVICPSRVGALGTIELNRNLQAHLNPAATGLAEHKFAGMVFRQRDKIMQIKNNYDILWHNDDGEEGTGVFNGDIGIIELIDRPSQTILIRYEDKVAEYSFDMVSEIEHAYAITVHKSQGSEFTAVIIPLMSFHPRLYYRNILYTGVTRAKSLLIMLGQQRTVSQMIENNRKVLRYTNLASFLEDNVLNPPDKS